MDIEDMIAELDALVRARSLASAHRLRQQLAEEIAAIDLEPENDVPQEKSDSSTQSNKISTDNDQSNQY